MCIKNGDSLDEPKKCDEHLELFSFGEINVETGGRVAVLAGCTTFVE